MERLKSLNLVAENLRNLVIFSEQMKERTNKQTN